jgi:hypothetical protein
VLDMRARAHALGTFLAVATLAVQFVPSALPLVAGAAHLAFHLSPRSGLDQLQGGSALAAGDQSLGSRRGVYFHRHGPGQPLHAHSVEVDRILRAATPPLHPQVGPTMVATQQVDQHVPATDTAVMTFISVKKNGVFGSAPAIFHRSRTPPVPPPRA